MSEGESSTSKRVQQHAETQVWAQDRPLQSWQHGAMDLDSLAVALAAKSALVLDTPLLLKVKEMKRYHLDPVSSSSLPADARTVSETIIDLTVSDGMTMRRVVLHPQYTAACQRGLIRRGSLLLVSEAQLIYDEVNVGTPASIMISGVRVADEADSNDFVISKVEDWSRHASQREQEVPLPLIGVRRVYIPELHEDGVERLLFMENGDDIQTIVNEFDPTMFHPFATVLSQDRPSPITGVVRSRSKLFYFGKPSQKLDYPLQFSFYLCDGKDDVLVTCWNSTAHRYFRTLQFGDVVTIKNYVVKKTGSVNTPFEIAINSRNPAGYIEFFTDYARTEVFNTYPQIAQCCQHTFLDTASLLKLPDNTQVHVLALVYAVGPMVVQSEGPYMRYSCYRWVTLAIPTGTSGMSQAVNVQIYVNQLGDTFFDITPGMRIALFRCTLHSTMLSSDLRERELYLRTTPYSDCMDFDTATMPDPALVAKIPKLHVVSSATDFVTARAPSYTPAMWKLHTQKSPSTTIAYANDSLELWQLKLGGQSLRLREQRFGHILCRISSVRYYCVANNELQQPSEVIEFLQELRHALAPTSKLKQVMQGNERVKASAAVKKEAARLQQMLQSSAAKDMGKCFGENLLTAVETLLAALTSPEQPLITSSAIAGDERQSQPKTEPTSEAGSESRAKGTGKNKRKGKGKGKGKMKEEEAAAEAEQDKSAALAALVQRSTLPPSADAPLADSASLLGEDVPDAVRHVLETDFLQEKYGVYVLRLASLNGEEVDAIVPSSFMTAYHFTALVDVLRMLAPQSAPLMSSLASAQVNPLDNLSDAAVVPAVLNYMSALQLGDHVRDAVVRLHLSAMRVHARRVLYTVLDAVPADGA